MIGHGSARPLLLRKKNTCMVSSSHLPLFHDYHRIFSCLCVFCLHFMHKSVWESGSYLVGYKLMLLNLVWRASPTQHIFDSV